MFQKYKGKATRFAIVAGSMVASGAAMAQEAGMQAQIIAEVDAAKVIAVAVATAVTILIFAVKGVKWPRKGA